MSLICRSRAQTLCRTAPFVRSQTFFKGVAMLISLLKGQLDFTTALVSVLVILLVIFVVLPFHEWAHAFTGMKLGDKSVKYRGRLTLNPLAHIDPIGALALLLFGFGWAKPVPIDSRNFKHPKLYMAITAIMGPIANITAAIAGGLIYHALYRIAPDFVPWVNEYGNLIGNKDFGYYVIIFLSLYIEINCFLAVFNLIPIPPLDGSKVLFMFLPNKWVQMIYQYQMYISIVFIFLIYSRVLSAPLNYLADGLTNGVMWLTGLPFGLS